MNNKNNRNRRNDATAIIATLAALQAKIKLAETLNDREQEFAKTKNDLTVVLMNAPANTNIGDVVKVGDARYHFNNSGITSALEKMDFLESQYLKAKTVSEEVPIDVENYMRLIGEVLCSEPDVNNTSVDDKTDVESQGDDCDDEDEDESSAFRMVLQKLSDRIAYLEENTGKIAFHAAEDAIPPRLEELRKEVIHLKTKDRFGGKTVYTADDHDCCGTCDNCCDCGCDIDTNREMTPIPTMPCIDIGDIDEKLVGINVSGNNIKATENSGTVAYHDINLTLNAGGDIILK